MEISAKLFNNWTFENEEIGAVVFEEISENLEMNILY